MINWLDIIILFIFAFCLIRGFRNGLLKQLVSLLGLVISFVLALYLSRPLGSRLAEMIDLNGGEAGEAAQLGELAMEGMDYLIGVEPIMSLISFVVLFIVLQFVTNFIAARLKLVNYIPLIGQLNMLGGLLLGLVKGFIYVFILINIISILPPEYLGEALHNSALAGYINQVFPNLMASLHEFFLEFYVEVMEQNS